MLSTRILQLRFIFKVLIESGNTIKRHWAHCSQHFRGISTFEKEEQYNKMAQSRGITQEESINSCFYICSMFLNGQIFTSVFPVLPCS